MIQKKYIRGDLDDVLNERHKAFILRPELIDELSKSEFGNNITYYRNTAELSLSSIAISCNTTKGNIWHIENGDRYPNSDLYLCMVNVLQINTDHANLLNDLRINFKRKRKEHDLSDISEFSVDLLRMQKNTARRIALLALLKSALARIELNYPSEDILSLGARAYGKEESVILKPLLEARHILSFIDEFDSMFYSKENLLIVIALFAKKIVLSRSEYAQLHLDETNRDMSLILDRLIKQLNDDVPAVERFKFLITELYKKYDNYGLKLESLQFFGVDFNNVLSDIKKDYMWRIIGG